MLTVTPAIGVPDSSKMIPEILPLSCCGAFRAALIEGNVAGPIKCVSAA